MKLKFISFIIVLAMFFTALPSSGAAPAVTITAPVANSTVSSDGVILEAEVENADKVLFFLNDEKVAEFEGEGVLSHNASDIEYAAHVFKVVAIKRGNNVKETQVKFYVRDFSETQVKDMDFNSFDGVAIGTSGFSGFNGNIQEGVPNGVIGSGEGPDDSVALKLGVGKINASNLYLAFINFALPSTNRDVYVFEHDVLISDMGARLRYETSPGVHSIIENGKIGSYELTPQTWYKLTTEFDLMSGSYKVYVDGEERKTGSISAITGTEIRIQWANSLSVDGYLLMDNFKVTRRVSTPIISSGEYFNGEEYVPFTTEVPAGIDRIRLYLDATFSAAGKRVTLYEDGVAMENVEFEINEDEGYGEIILINSTIKAGASYKLFARAGGITTDLFFGFKSPTEGIGVMQLMFNAGSYQAKYQAQLTDGANVSTTVVVTNKTNEAKPIMAIVCAYKNGEMTGIRAAKATAPANGPAFMNVPALSVDSDTEIICHIVDGWEMRRPVMVAGQLLKQ